MNNLWLSNTMFQNIILLNSNPSQTMTSHSINTCTYMTLCIIYLDTQGHLGWTSSSCKVKITRFKTNDPNLQTLKLWLFIYSTKRIFLQKITNVVCKVHCKDWKRKFEISPKLCLAYEKNPQRRIVFKHFKVYLNIIHYPETQLYTKKRLHLITYA